MEVETRDYTISFDIKCNSDGIHCRYPDSKGLRGWSACRFFVDGLNNPWCFLFGKLVDSDGGIEGRLLRRKECLDIAAENKRGYFNECENGVIQALPSSCL